MVLFSKSITLMTMDLNKNIMEIEGKVAYCKMEKSKSRVAQGNLTCPEQNLTLQ
jgi:hypothetical protein